MLHHNINLGDPLPLPHDGEHIYFKYMNIKKSSNTFWIIKTMILLINVILTIGQKSSFV